MGEDEHSHDEHAKARHRQLAAVLIMAVTLLGGVLELLDNRISDRAASYGDEAHQELVQALGDRESATASIAREQQAETAAAVDLALAAAQGGAGTGAGAGAGLVHSEAGADRAAASVTATTSTLGPRAAVLTDNRPASILFEVGHTRSFLRTREFQEADEHAAEGWGSRSQQVETAIAIMAVSLFLLGLSHTVPVARARAVFTITGVAIAVLAGAWGLSAAVRSVDGPSPRAIDAYLDADGEIHVALDSAGVPLAPLLRGAISKLNTAISLRPGYANALFDRALAAADLAFALKPVRGSAQAVSDLRAAMRYGGDSSLYESNLANDAFWLGRYSEAVAAANRAVSLNPGSLTAVQNQAQYLNLVPGVRRSDVVRSVALLRRDFIDTPHLLADPVYRGLQEELTLVEQYMPALADRARQWQLQLTREIGPLDRP